MKQSFMKQIWKDPVSGVCSNHSKAFASRKVRVLARLRPFLDNEEEQFRQGDIEQQKLSFRWLFWTVNLLETAFWRHRTVYHEVFSASWITKRRIQKEKPAMWGDLRRITKSPNVFQHVLCQRSRAISRASARLGALNSRCAPHRSAKITFQWNTATDEATWSNCNGHSPLQCWWLSILIFSHPGFWRDFGFTIFTSWKV